MLLRDVSVGGQSVDVRFHASISAMASSLVPHADEEVIDGGGGALIPGLHDHHLHLLALAATSGSTRVSTRADLSAAAAKGAGWLRATGFPDELDRVDLDAISPVRPLRVQHRSGALWSLNSSALRALGLADHPDGKLWRADQELGERLRAIGADSAPSLRQVGDELARHGITGVTDATPDLDASARLLITTAQGVGDLPQAVHLLSPGKIVIGDHCLPDLGELASSIAALHADAHPVALHCVTREALALAIAALREVGSITGDRIEHGSLMDLPTTKTLAELGVSVTTQPGFISDRGDGYLREVDATDHDDLYRYASLHDAGACAVPSSDAPFGPLDPWAVMRSARDRVTETGRELNPAERVSATTALDGYLRPLTNLHAPAREVIVGAPADLVLLSTSLPRALEALDAANVRATWCAGASVFTC